MSPRFFAPLSSSRTTDTQWGRKSKISEKVGRCGRQNMLRLYLKNWEWEWIFGRAVKAISSLGSIRSSWYVMLKKFWKEKIYPFSPTVADTQNEQQDRQHFWDSPCGPKWAWGTIKNSPTPSTTGCWAAATCKVDTIQVFLCELGMKPCMQLCIGNHHFFTIPCHRQTYHNY